MVGVTCSSRTSQEYTSTDNQSSCRQLEGSRPLTLLLKSGSLEELTFTKSKIVSSDSEKAFRLFLRGKGLSSLSMATKLVVFIQNGQS